MSDAEWGQLRRTFRWRRWAARAALAGAFQAVPYALWYALTGRTVRSLVVAAGALLWLGVYLYCEHASIVDIDPEGPQ